MDKKKFLAVLSAIIVLSGFGFYRQIGDSTGPNSWTYRFGSVLAEAAKTGYPILYIDVNSSTCSHCHTLNQLTLSSAEFRALEKDIAFYQVMTDDASMRTSGGSALYNRYGAYYDDDSYPLVAVIAKDGSVYGSFGNYTTDERNVAADLRKLIEELSMKQIGKVLHTDGSETTAETPSSPSASDSNKPAVVPVAKPTTLAGWAAFLKGKANGIVFDASENLAGTLAINSNNKGKITVKLTMLNGKSTIKAMLELDEDGKPSFSADGLKMSYDGDNGLWIGDFNGGKAFASKGSTKNYDGLYTFSAGASSSAGYLTLTAKNGKGKIAGMLDGRNKVSANGTGIALPARVVAANIPQWDAGSDIALYPVLKTNKGIYGCMVATKSGSAAGELFAVGKDWEARGQKWNVSTSLTPLNGTIVTAGEWEIPVVAVSATKIAADENAYKAKVQAQVRKGIFKGSMKLPQGRLQFEGALIGSGTNIYGFGVSFGTGVYPVTLGSDDECGECTITDK